MSTYRKITYTLTSADVPCSVRAYLKKRGYSHKTLTALSKDENLVLVNKKAGRLIRFITEPCELCVYLPTGESAVPSAPPKAQVTVVYEDNDIIVFNKPPFMPTHPSKRHQGDSLYDFAAYYFAQKGESFTFRPVCRLDRNTSGLVLAAKTAYAASRLSGRIDKIYYAIAEGEITSAGKIDAPIARAREGCVLRCVREDGDRAVTEYEPVAQKNGLSLLRLHLLTGRTHQIRVHMAHIGHPLAGDDLYGGGLSLGIKRQALHCIKLRFTHPVTGEPMSFQSPLPDDMRTLGF